MVAPRRRQFAGRVPALVVVLGLAGCGGAPSRVAGAGGGDGAAAPGTYVGDAAVSEVAGALLEEKRTAYYLGAEADGLQLTHIERVTENGPGLQVWASYGTCSPEPGADEGGCADPVTTGTQEWRPDLTGVWCRRLEPQLGVPAGEIMGELTLFTERAQVSVVHVGDREGAGTGLTQALALLRGLTQVGGTAPVTSLPPPEPEVAAWVDELCGTVPGQVVEHPME
jgi:hypothetical protein